MHLHDKGNSKVSSTPQKEAPLSLQPLKNLLPFFFFEKDINMVNNPLFDVTDRGAHVLIALIWAAALVSINLIEFTNMAALIPALGVGTFLLFLVCQNIGVAIANAYFQTNVEMSASGLKETTTKQPMTNDQLTQEIADLKAQLTKAPTAGNPAAAATSQ